jgi:hypothetical protein
MDGHPAEEEHRENYKSNPARENPTQFETNIPKDRKLCDYDFWNDPENLCKPAPSEISEGCRTAAPYSQMFDEDIKRMIDEKYSDEISRFEIIFPYIL